MTTNVGERQESPDGSRPPTRRLEGQGAIVTGGARGIGLGIAQRLAKEGCRVVLWDRSFEAFDAAAAGFSPASLQTVNVADYGQVEQAFAASEQALGTIDILVNNAGINGPVAPTWEYPLEAWDRVLAVDLTGVFYCCRAVVPHLRARGYGRIVNVASIAGKEGNQGIAAYAAAKAGVIGLTKCARAHRDRPGPRNDAGTHRACPQPDTDGAHAAGARGGGNGRLDCQSGVQLQHRIRVRPVRRSRHVLIFRRRCPTAPRRA